MTKAEFKKLVENGPVILDGATGTNLQKAGMPVGVGPEQWILENPDIMIKLQEDYVAPELIFCMHQHLLQTV